MKKVGFRLWAFVIALTMPIFVQAQNAGMNDAAKNADQARTLLNQMVQALGGQAWLNQKNVMQRGQIAAFFHNEPNLGTTEIWMFHQWPDKDRIEVTKHRDVVDFFLGNEGWEVTYRGKKPMVKEQLDDFLRRRDHSIETVVKVWMKDPKTILLYEGKKMAERHLADQVTLINAENDATTILLDSDSHLPLQRSFQWRDPVYKDKNTDREDYDGYHVVDGFPTPYTITRYKNDELVRQFYVTKVEYNRDLPPDFWDVDATAHRIKKR
ncbi:MAG: hypothetical protein KGN79_05825 [Acidobacteriota bacterium]|nr:hypothetical protein [Acidobacteriota bacterium]